VIAITSDHSYRTRQSNISQWSTWCTYSPWYRAFIIL